MFGDKAAAASLNSSGNYMGEGLYRVKTKSFKLKDGYKGKSVIHEFTITQSNNPAHPVGSSGSWVVKTEKDQANGDLKGFMLAMVLGVDPKTVKDFKIDPTPHNDAIDALKAALGDPASLKKLEVEDGFLVGMECGLECVKKKTKAGGDFTVHNWQPLPDEPESTTAS